MGWHLLDPTTWVLVARAGSCATTSQRATAAALAGHLRLLLRLLQLCHHDLQLWLEVLLLAGQERTWLLPAFLLGLQQLLKRRRGTAGTAAWPRASGPSLLCWLWCWVGYKHADSVGLLSWCCCCCCMMVRTALSPARRRVWGEWVTLIAGQPTPVAVHQQQHLQQLKGCPHAFLPGCHAFLCSTH